MISFSNRVGFHISTSMKSSKKPAPAGEGIISGTKNASGFVARNQSLKYAKRLSGESLVYSDFWHNGLVIVRFFKCVVLSPAV